MSCISKKRKGNYGKSNLLRILLHMITLDFFHLYEVLFKFTAGIFMRVTWSFTRMNLLFYTYTWCYLAHITRMIIQYKQEFYKNRIISRILRLLHQIGLSPIYFYFFDRTKNVFRNSTVCRAVLKKCNYKTHHRSRQIQIPIL